LATDFSWPAMSFLIVDPPMDGFLLCEVSDYVLMNILLLHVSFRDNLFSVIYKTMSAV